MSLAAVLAGEQPAGVYRWSHAYAPGIEDDLQRAAVAAGWAFAPVWGTATKDEALEGLGAALGFDDHYGRNLDALADCLRDLAGPTLVLWAGWSALASADSASFEVIVQILGAAADLAVLLPGPGPEVDVPRL